MQLSTPVRQAIASGTAAVVAVAAIWGLDLHVLNEPAIQGLIVATAGALASLLVKDAPPTLKDAYHVVEKANQARDAERWRTAVDQPGSLLADDGFQRPEPPQPTLR